MSKGKRVLLGASYSVIEPLGALHLGSIARQEGWDVKYVLVEDDKFEVADEIIDDWKPNIFGYTTRNRQTTFVLSSRFVV